MTPLSIYMQSIPNVPLLTKTEEHQLAVRIREGDTKAKELLIISNLRLVVNIAQSYSRRSSIPLTDLIGEGNLGLIKAAERFHEEHDTKFSTYAINWIKSFIRLAVVTKNRDIVIPQHVSALIAKWLKAIDNLADGYNTPTDHEIAAKAMIDPSHIECVKAAIASFNKTDNAGRNDFDLMDIIENRDTEDESPTDELKAVLDSIDELPNREKIVIQMRFGFGQEKMDLKSIGEKLGISQNRVRQTERLALRRLRVRLTKKLPSLMKVKNEPEKSGE